MNREPSFDDLVGAEETSGAERERLRGVHELLLQAGPPAELTPRLRKAPSFGVVRLQPRKPVRQRAMLLLAAALSIAAVFAAGYAVADHRSGGTSASPPEKLSLRGTSNAPGARATLEVWHPQAGNWPMTLSVTGLPKLPRGTYYEVYLVRDGKPWGSCGTFRVAGDSSGAITLRLNAPYSLRPGDSWVVTRAAPGSEPGRTVLRPV
ncbi:MAG TPA: anti-sigma factor [Gaiellaceae bacterium]|nr:anti-sigma factor [Gaiellaceae bacterium]